VVAGFYFKGQGYQCVHVGVADLGVWLGPERVPEMIEGHLNMLNTEEVSHLEARSCLKHRFANQMNIVRLFKLALNGFHVLIRLPFLFTRHEVSLVLLDEGVNNRSCHDSLEKALRRVITTYLFKVIEGRFAKHGLILREVKDVVVDLEGDSEVCAKVKQILLLLYRSEAHDDSDSSAAQGNH
jgi:hypothetical protein